MAPPITPYKSLVLLDPLSVKLNSIKLPVAVPASV